MHLKTTNCQKMLLKDIFVKDKRQARSKQVAGDKDGKGFK